MGCRLYFNLNECCCGNTQELLEHLLFRDASGSGMFKINNINNRRRCELCSKLTIKTPERRQWRLNAGWKCQVFCCRGAFRTQANI